MQNYQKKCVPLAKTSTNIWLLGDSGSSGLCNQLFGVFSYIPVAKLFNASGLVVGELYSRHGFDGAHSRSWSKLPFSWFFDWEYFKSYWKNEGLDMIENTHFNSCYGHYHAEGYLNRVFPIKREPAFWPLQPDKLLELLPQSNVLVPIPQKSLLTVEGDNHFSNLFWFFDPFDVNIPFAEKIYSSLQPSPMLEPYIQAILRYLPENFVSIHIRLENDFLGDNPFSFVHQFPYALQHVYDSKCFRNLSKTATNSSDSNAMFEDAPMVYIASGLLTYEMELLGMRAGRHRGNVKGPAKNMHFNVEHNHTSTLLKGLEGLGLMNLSDRTTILQKVFLAQRERANENLYGRNPMLETVFTVPDEIANLPELDMKAYEKLYPEQLALIDFVVSRKAACFAHAHVSSSFSYLVQRFRHFDEVLAASAGGQDVKRETFHDITEEKYGKCFEFRHWGL
jgi:hypothetical protein